MQESGYRRLKQAVERGEIEITLIDSPPRTAGSALFRSLSQFYDASFYEAFHPNRGTFDEICDHIAKKIEDTDTFRTPKRILVKTLPRHFSANDWSKWQEICSHFVYVARDPQLQMYSLLERNANDLYFNRKGASGLTPDEVWNYADRVGAWLQNGGERVGEANQGGSTDDQLKIAGDFSRACWRDMQNHIHRVQEEVSTSQGKKSLSLVSGFLLRTDSKNIMRELLSRLNLPCNEHALDTACSHWDENSKNSVYVAELGASAYTEPVRNASGFLPPLEPTPLLEKFPEGTFRKHIEVVALPVYAEFLANPYLLGKETLKNHMRHIVESSSQADSPLLHANPVDVYAHVSAMDASAPVAAANTGYRGAGGTNNIIKNSLLRKMRDAFPDFTSSFDALDTHRERSDSPPRVRVNQTLSLNAL